MVSHLKNSLLVKNFVSKFNQNHKYFCFSALANGNYKIEEGQCNTDTLASIPRADVAHFMLAVLQTDSYDRKTMAIASL